MIFFLCTQVPGNDDRNTLNALWGKLGSEILMQNWETALEDLNRLKDVIESNVSFVNPCHSVHVQCVLFMETLRNLQIDQFKTQADLIHVCV